MKWTALLGALLVATGVARAAEEATPDETKPVPRPEIRVGDMWSFRVVNNWTGAETFRGQAIVEAVVNGVVIERADYPGGERDSHWTTEWNSVSSVDGSNYAPHWSVFHFPLVIGASRDVEFDNTSRRGYWKYKAKVTVAGWEDVEVPAGRFRALRIVQDVQWFRQDQARDGTAKRVFWYVPRVKRWVKYTYEDRDRRTGPYAKTMIELVGFKVE